MSEILTVYPSGYDPINYSYGKSISPLSNAVGHSSSDPAQSIWLLNQCMYAESYVFYLFDLSTIPENAVIDSVSCTAYGSISATRSVASGQAQMYCGTSIAKGTYTSMNGSSGSLTLACGTWTREELNDCRIRLYAKRGYKSPTATINQVFGGATLTVEYTIPESGPTLYVKEDGAFNVYSTVYKKVNGVWVLQSDLESLFGTTTNYVKGN